MDVAGLVPGAHLGHGMGNQFLDDLRQADVLIHVVDVSGSVNEKGEPVQVLSYDPANDVRFLETELNMWILGIIKKGWDKFARQIMQEKKDVFKALATQLSGLKISEEMVKTKIHKLNLDPEKPSSWTEKNLMDLATQIRLTSKPMLIACNKIDVPGAEKNFVRLKEMFPDYLFIPCSAEAEVALRLSAKSGIISYTPGDNDFKILLPEKLSEKQKQALEFIREKLLKVFGSSGVQDVLDKAVFEFLKYIAIFPGGVNKLADSDGNILPDCFLLHPGSTALDFAFHIHTDLGNHFIRAIDAKTKRTVGKEHLLKHCDVMEIVSDK